MPLLTKTEIKRIQAKYKAGIPSGAVVELFAQRGLRFSGATLRKYVQLGLLPTSQRVSLHGRRGSGGLYPVAIVGLINVIKKALADGQTLQDLSKSNLGLHSELEILRRNSLQLFAKIEENLKQQRGRLRTQLKQELQRSQVKFKLNFLELTSFLGRLSSPVSHS